MQDNNRIQSLLELRRELEQDLQLALDKIAAKRKAIQSCTDLINVLRGMPIEEETEETMAQPTRGKKLPRPKTWDREAIEKAIVDFGADLGEETSTTYAALVLYLENRNLVPKLAAAHIAKTIRTYVREMDMFKETKSIANGGRKILLSLK